MKKYKIFYKHFALLIATLLFSGILSAQDTAGLVRGTVTDEMGEPIIGATVVVVGTQTGTATDLDGVFTINAPLNQTLKISSIGFVAQDVKVTSTDMKIVLAENSTQLGDIVVVGYGVMRKSDLTASISSIKAADIAATSTTSVDQGLQGRAAGVVVLNTSGQPGAATSIRIRGTSSIMGTNEPLYVIDGIPVISDASASSTGTLQSPALNPLTNINPNDIESMEVLKDASATSIYGARGANGVVLITTKKGQSGKAKISFGARYTIQTLSKKMKMLNSSQIAELGNEATDNDGIPRNEIFADYNNIAKLSTDWQDEIFRTAPLQSYDVSISGGGAKNSYFASGNILTQDGIIIGSDFSKGTVRLNLDQEVSKYVKVGFFVNGTYSVSHGVVTNSEGAFSSSITGWALEMNPGLPVKDKSGKYTYENNMYKPNVGNPVQDAYEAVNKSKSFRTLANGYIEIKPMKDLLIKSTLGIDYFTLKDQAFAPEDIKRAESVNGYANIGNSDGYTWVTEHTATWLKTLNKHSFNVLIGFTAQKFQAENSQVGTVGFDDGTLGFHSIQMGKLRQTALSGVANWQMLSYLTRINYSYDSRYILTLTGRIDGSSKFGKGNKYGTFPSIAAAWRASEEKFMKNVSSISNLKVRASYGLVGNEGIPPYSSQSRMYKAEAYYGNSGIMNGLMPYTQSNKDLKWETTAQADFGLDLGFFDNRLSLSADLYYKKTSDLLLHMPVLLHTGYDRVFRNVGDMENKGFDFSINAVPITTQNFTWNSDFTFGFNRNEVTNLDGVNNIPGGQVKGKTYWTKVTAGKSIGTLYGYKTDGIVQLGEDPSTIPFFRGKKLAVGDRKYVNKNEDSELNEEDLFELGNANPDFTYGFGNTFEYQMKDKSRLRLTVFLQGVYGNEIVNFNKFDLESFNGFKNNSTAALNRWTPTNPSNKYPRATQESSDVYISDHQVEDGSYLRVKDITLGYDFSPKLASRFKTSGISVYMSLKNIHTFTNYSGYDPEVSRFANDNLSMGADLGSYPMAKACEFGVKVNF